MRETETNDQISLLNVRIDKTGHRFQTDLFRKNALTALGMNYKNAASDRYKDNPV